MFMTSSRLMAANSLSTSDTQLGVFEPALFCFEKDLLDTAAEQFQPLVLAAAAGPFGHRQARCRGRFAGRRRPAIADTPGPPCWD